MKKSILILLLTIPLVNVFGQENGIRFEHGNTWKQIQAKAKAENKYIMVDCYTTWCMPCKVMSKKVFTQQKVSEYYNKNFINVKIQLDTTSKDDKEVKLWYADANKIATEAEVAKYPTYLFFNPEGKLVGQTSGLMEADAFIEAGHNALNPELQYPELVKRYHADPSDKTVIKLLAFKSKDAADEPLATEVGEKYLAYDKELSKDQVKYILAYTGSSSDQGFKLAQEHAAEIDKISGSDKAEELTDGIIMQEEIMPLLGQYPDPKSINWQEVTQKVQAKYPQNAKSAVLSTKVSAVMMLPDAKDRDELFSEIKKESAGMPAENWAKVLNKLCMSLIAIKDKPLANQLVTWSQEAANIKGTTQGTSYTSHHLYALALYKAGKKSEAITAEKTALKIAGFSETDSTYNGMLKKMESGEDLFKH